MVLTLSATTYLRVGHTTVVPRLRVRLVLAITVATSGTATHCSEFTICVRNGRVSVIQSLQLPSIVSGPDFCHKNGTQRYDVVAAFQRGDLREGRKWWLLADGDDAF